MISLPYSSVSRSPISSVRSTCLSSHSSCQTTPRSPCNDNIKNDDIENGEKASNEKMKKSQKLSKLLSVCSNGLANKGINFEHLQSYVRNAQGFPVQSS